MNIFISWSKSLSKECAEILKDWIECTLQASKPWVSSQDIDKGSLWFGEINDQLKDTSVGIVCLTKENKNNPWILFESGALAKGLSANKVCTFLIDLTPADLEGPLSQFNATIPDRDGLKSLLATINNELGEKALESKILDRVFDTYWPIFHEKFESAIANAPESENLEPDRTENEILTEILLTTRTLDKRVRKIESGVDSDPTNARLAGTFRDLDVSTPLKIRALKSLIMHRINDYANENFSGDLSLCLTSFDQGDKLDEWLINLPEIRNFDALGLDISSSIREVIIELINTTPIRRL